MAVVLKVSNGTTDVSLLGTYLYPGDWRSSPTDQGVMETFDMKALGSDANIIGAVNDLDEIAEKIFQYWDDPLKGEEWWLYVGATAESSKRSLIRSLSIMPAQSQQFNPMLGKGGMFYELLIERMPWWENAATTTVYTSVAMGAMGGSWIPSLTQGNLPSRIGMLEVIADTGMSTEQVKFWLGIQPKYSTATYTGFDAIIQAEDGTRYNSATEETGDGDDSGNSVKTPLMTAGGSFTPYLSITISQHEPTNDFMYRGRWLVLGRMKATGGGTVAAKMLWGCLETGSTNMFPNPIVYVHETSYKWYELGEVSFPSQGIFAGDDTILSDGIYMYARHVSGASSYLHMDCFVLMPCRHMVKVTGGRIVDSTTDYRVQVYQEPNDDVIALNLKNATTGSGKAQIQVSNWELPISGAVVVIATEGTVAALGETLILNMNYYPHWSNHRE